MMLRTEVLLALLAAFVTLCHSQSNGIDTNNTIEASDIIEPSNGTEAINITTTTIKPITEFSVNPTHASSSTSSITISWISLVPVWIQVLKQQIRTQKNGSQSLILSPDLAPETEEYVVDNLMTNSEYHVCVVSWISNISAESTEPSEIETKITEITTCMDAFTIPLIRDDSVLVLAAVIGVFIALIIIGFVTWKCAVRTHEKEEENEKLMQKLERKQREHLEQVTRPVATKDEEDAPFLTPPTSRGPQKQDGRSVYRPANMA